MTSSMPASSQEQPHPRVIIVDDMPQVRQDLHLLLQLTGEIDVVGEARNGQEAIQQAEVLHPDVVVVDLKMPGMDGCQVAQVIKARSLAGKVILLSIHADPQDIERSRRAGADAYIQKGADISILVRAIHAA